MSVSVKLMNTAKLVPVDRNGYVYVGKPYIGRKVIVLFLDQLHTKESIDEKERKPCASIQLIPKITEELRGNQKVNKSALAKKYEVDRGTIAKTIDDIMSTGIF